MITIVIPATPRKFHIVKRELPLPLEETKLENDDKSSLFPELNFKHGVLSKIRNAFLKERNGSIVGWCGTCSQEICTNPSHRCKNIECKYILKKNKKGQKLPGCDFFHTIHEIYNGYMSGKFYRLRYKYGGKMKKKN
ncbi:MAG: hypothetical protein Harvfovirus35_7 [Harvfovirus sp.]|uniref:Uncharacterized protein n=1 Tax=Harvfovirus sp. TaxID=2487768 RepID=A0A3G5A2K8_9VIRU|nr:MAG: hypothetical protein Harvfovirus35_7 [Harvfovirus sp.]